jgi:hypothetical protein
MFESEQRSNVIMNSCILHFLSYILSFCLRKFIQSTEVFFCLISSESKDRKMSKTQEKLLKLSQGQGQGNDATQDAGLVSGDV